VPCIVSVVVLNSPDSKTAAILVLLCVSLFIIIISFYILLSAFNIDTAEKLKKKKTSVA
jgi:phosphotransferase system  glucose/maltose/N-acetylglucosamine-specific IIC component